MMSWMAGEIFILIQLTMEGIRSMTARVNSIIERSIHGSNKTNNATTPMTFGTNVRVCS